MPESLIGMPPAVRLRADTPLRAFDVEAAVRDRARRYREPDFPVRPADPRRPRPRARRRAQGETIRFVNLQSNRTVEAVADGPGRARVTRSAYTH
jgi:flagella basal body P-ring formation protein FlgA